MDERRDAELVECAAQGDREAFAALLARHYPFIFRVAYKWCGSRTDAEDAAQDVCVKLGSAIGSFDGRAAFRSWLYRVTLNTVRDGRKMRARREQRVAELAIVAEASATAAGGCEPMDDRTGDLWEAVRALPDAERDAVLLVYSEGMNHADAAEVLGCKAGTVSWRISNAKTRLKSLLRDELQ